MDSLGRAGKVFREGGPLGMSQADRVKSIQSEQRPRVRKRSEGFGEWQNTSMAGVSPRFVWHVWMGWETPILFPNRQVRDSLFPFLRKNFPVYINGKLTCFFRYNQGKMFRY